MNLFISYAHVDKWQVKQLVEILRDAGHDPWFDHQLIVGADWRIQLRSAIKECEAFLYTLSPESVTSEWCLWELSEAIKLGKPIIPVLIQAKTELPASLSRYQYADFTAGPTPSGVARLLGGLHSARVIIPRTHAPKVSRSPIGTPAQAVAVVPNSEQDIKPTMSKNDITVEHLGQVIAKRPKRTVRCFIL